MKVAVVRNRDNSGVVCRFGQPCPEVYGKSTVQKVIDALRSGGHTVGVFEGDKRLVANLEQFMPTDPQSGLPGGMVLNMGYGIQGDARYTHVPAMLEMAGIPYTGASPAGHAFSLDKIVTKILMMQAGVPTPNYCVMTAKLESSDHLRFPLIVKPRHESTSYGLHLVKNRQELEQAVLEVIAKYQQDALVEEYIAGREVCIGLLGNDPVEFLPPVELNFENRKWHVLTWDDKYHKSIDEPIKICPAKFDSKMLEKLNHLAISTFRACQCKDYSRVDIRIDENGNPFVLEINSMASLGLGGSFVLAAKTAGYTFESLILRILDLAHTRYFGKAAPLGDHAESHSVQIQDQGTACATNKSGTMSRSADQQSDCQNIPCKITPFYDSWLRQGGYYEKLRSLVEPSEAEVDDSGSLDTSGERDNTKVRGLQHKYPKTALMLVTDKCFSYCRFCFRKRFVGQPSEEIVADYALAANYIKEHPEITDVLLSGGDPFVLSSEQLNNILDHLLTIPHLSSIRFGTRGLVFEPQRFQDKSLKELFRRITAAGKVPAIVTHVDHFAEISPETIVSIGELKKYGVQLFNQTVLLKDINDDAETLATTFARLHELGVRPYYLFQTRPVKGTSHFQVPLGQGTQIVRDVTRRLSGMQKTFRYIMSHYSGKIEILDVGKDNRIYMRYHQSIDPKRVGAIFWRPFSPTACWLDDLPCVPQVQACEKTQSLHDNDSRVPR